jgi:tungstate transport system ATP-binding protein
VDVTQPWVYQLRDVAQSYAGNPVLRVNSLEVLRGEVLCLVGPTGAGKSTLLRLLAGLEPPAGGDLWFGDQRLDGQALPLAARRRITMLFQRPLLLTGTVQANVEYGLRLRGVRQPSARAQAVLRRFRLTDLAGRYGPTLSGGQAQLVAVARALALEPDVLLLDEPTAHLDPSYVALVEEAVGEFQSQRQATLVWATHQLFQARRVAHRVALLLDGRLVEVAPTQKFFEAPCDPRTAAFVQGKMVY